MQQLSERGWTDALVKRFLGEPDGWEPVNHWANWTGKRTYFLKRVQIAEASPEFEAAYRRSVLRRKLTEQKIAAFAEQRVAEELRESRKQGS